MKKIKLTQGKYALIDDEEYEKVKNFSWYAAKMRNGRYYVQCSKNSSHKALKLHRVIMNCNNSKIKIDHINRNPLDNRKNNLRFCTNSQNGQNVNKSKRNTSGFKGVYFRSDRNKWRSYITVDKKIIYLGLFNSKKEASIAYNNATLKYHKEFSYLK